MLKVLVYGWYGESIKNIGDLLFCKAFQKLFPDFNFTFTNVLRAAELTEFDAVIFGGGSFLYAPINMGKNDRVEDIVSLLKTKKVFYIGVGIETDIHPTHQQIISFSDLVATRTNGGVDKVKKFAATKTIQIPDIVSCLAGSFSASSLKSKSVLVLPNAELLPRWSDIHWKHASWDYFKSEFSQFLDALRESGHTVSFAAMCRNDNMHDLGAATEIINRMKHRSFTSQIFNLTEEPEQLAQVLGRYELIITQRYHGAILAEIVQRPCVSIAHHDKLKNPTNSSVTVPYYGVSKDTLFKALETSKTLNILPIKLDTFEALRNCVYSTIGTKCPSLSV
jgi:polysaccharide pyruvyl transferase WcaK-like protein